MLKGFNKGRSFFGCEQHRNWPHLEGMRWWHEPQNAPLLHRVLRAGMREDESKPRQKLLGFI